MLTRDELKAIALSQAKVKAEYDALQHEFKLYTEMLKKRRLANLFQYNHLVRFSLDIKFIPDHN